MNRIIPMAYGRAGRVGLLITLLAVLLPALQTRPAAAQPSTPARVTYEIFMPWITDTGDEIRTTDSLVLGRPNAAEAAADKPPLPPSDTTQIEPPPPGAARIAGPPESPKTGSGDAPAVAAGWHILHYEDFEGNFPSGAWRVVDDSGVSNREITWDDDDHRPHSGQWSAWAANGGADGLDPAVYRYANNMRAWMVYGPFSLAEADQATLTFDYWNRSERNYDWFGWYASSDGVNFHGWRASGDSGGWRATTLDLTAVPVIGDLRGDSSVWIAFVFRSDNDGVEAGAFVDNVALHQATLSVPCPDQALAEYFPNRDLSGSPTLTRCENLPITHNWGNGSPAASLPADNFSARWTGTIALPAGRYTFYATVDDGLRLWLDDRLLIDSWRQQSASLEVSTEVSAGLHRLRVEYFEQDGEAEARVHWSADSACPTITAWRGEYWSNDQLSGAPVRCRNDAAVDFNWGVGSPSAEVPTDHFSARWTRTVNFNAGTYRFHLRGDDGVRLWVDDTLLIDEWRTQSATDFSALIPLSAGSHKLKVEYFESTNNAEVKLWWEVAPQNAVVISNRPAFDTCPLLPTTGQMATWWAHSPYREVNVYMGGANLGCPAYAQALNASWVATVGNQGWNFIPTWVGPQAPCTNYWSRFAYDLNTAYQAGRSEADAAARAARDLGLTASGLGGSVIYYDMEAYDTGSGDSTMEACRAAANSFVNGWVQRLNELGNRAGVYGAAYASHVSDWAGLEHVPDDIWVAHWIDDAYNPNITVWDMGFVDDSLWTNHQRIFQYTDGHNESYGGVTLFIDSNIVDGRVFGPNPRASSVTAAAENVAVPAPLRGLERLPSGAGWLLSAQQLNWSDDNGASWRDITPGEAAGKTLRAATFLDDQQGWLVWAGTPDTQHGSTLHVSTTDDGGASWHTTPLTAFAPRGPNPTQTPVEITFVDDQTGWIAIRLATGTAFSEAALFGTRDGGQSWTPLALPSAGTLRFVDARRGWLVGGLAGETLYATGDGGQSWQVVDLPVTALGATHHLPVFADAQNGVAPVTVVEGERGSVAFYRSGDGGATWTAAASVPLSSTHALVEPLDARAPDRWLVADTASGTLYHVALAGDAVEVTRTDLLPGVTHLAFAGADQGWAAARATTCFGDKSGADTSDPFRCVWQQSVIASEDGGQTWDEITP